jgi:hypothetical protein
MHDSPASAAELGPGREAGLTIVFAGMARPKTVYGGTVFGSG